MSNENAFVHDGLLMGVISDDNIGEVQQMLDSALAHTTGVTAKGITAIHLLAQGYSCREIGERMGGASANNVAAWVSRARRFLRKWQTGFEIFNK